MKIMFQCSCGKQLQADTKLVGKIVACPTCKKHVQVPPSSKSAPKPVAQKPAPTKPAPQKPVAQKPVAQKPVAQKPVAQNPTPPKPATQKPAPQNPAPQKPAPQNPARQASAKPTRPASNPATKPVAPTPGPVAQAPNADKIQINCHCGQLLSLPVELNGTTIKCPKCQDTFVADSPDHPKAAMPSASVDLDDPLAAPLPTQPAFSQPTLSAPAWSQKKPKRVRKPVQVVHDAPGVWLAGLQITGISLSLMALAMLFSFIGLLLLMMGFSSIRNGSPDMPSAGTVIGTTIIAAILGILVTILMVIGNIGLIVGYAMSISRRGLSRVIASSALGSLIFTFVLMGLYGLVLALAGDRHDRPTYSSMRNTSVFLTAITALLYVFSFVHLYLAAFHVLIANRDFKIPYSMAAIVAMVLLAIRILFSIADVFVPERLNFSTGISAVGLSFYVAGIGALAVGHFQLRSTIRDRQR